MKLYDSTLSYSSEELEEIYASGNIASGPYLAKVESFLTSYTRSRSSYLFADMTTALVELLRELGIGRGSKVGAHAYSCLSTTAAIELVGAEVVWIDLDHDGPWISYEDLERKAEGIDLLINYNIAGYVGSLEIVQQICDSHDIPFINDCNASFLTEYKGELVTRFGDYAILCFYPNRIVNGIDGGAVICNTRNLTGLENRKRFGIDRVKYRDKSGDINPLCDVEFLTSANNLSNISAYHIFKSLSRIDYIREIASETVIELDNYFYSKTYAKDEAWVVPWLYPVKCQDPVEYKSRLVRRGIPATRLHFPNNVYSVFNKNGLSPELPNTKKLYSNVIWLPVHRDVIKGIENEV